MTRLTGFLLCFFLSITAYAANMTLTSKAFVEDITIPVLYTCDGKDISPDLSWSNIPKNTKSLAIVLSDKDAPNGIFYHWVIFNIPANVQAFAQDLQQLPSGSVVGNNSWDRSRYNGPCPPKGALHHYVFTLYALDKKLSLSEKTNAPSLIKAMQGHILQQATLNTAFARWP